jgi:integrase
VSIRKLPSGRYQATVYRPDGSRDTDTFDLKRQAKTWEDETKAKYRRGEDPRAGQITVAEWYERWLAVHGVVTGTRKKIESLWRVHCEPQWANWPMASITRMEVKGWIRKLETTKGARGRTLAASTVHEIAHTMSSLYRAAMDDTPPRVTHNPFDGLSAKKGVLPTIPPQPIMFYEHEEADAIIAALERWPERAALVDLGFYSGPRPGEMFGLHGDRVRWLRRAGAPGTMEITRVMTRTGLREYPKSRKSHRDVPIRPATMDRLDEIMPARSLDGPVFTRAEGGSMDDNWFRHRVWDPAVKRAGVRPLPPRAMRHTAASWLVQDGVPLTEVQRLLGHESYSTTERYAHLRPGHHGAITDAWERQERRSG